MNSALAITRDRKISTVIRSALAQDFTIARSPHIEDALETLKKKRSDILFFDIEQIECPPSTIQAAREMLRPFWNLYPAIEIVIMAPVKMIREAVKFVKAGAGDYLTYPVIPDEVRLVVSNLAETVILTSELEYLREREWKSDALDAVGTDSSQMKQVFQKVKSVAPTITTVMLTGETGVGKGVVAKLIHQLSNRENARFISVHCGAIPDSLVESELFGHEKGAFTGAVRQKIGRFEIAQGGTIFLDEIGTITPPVQVKLLQVLQDGIFFRVGGESVIESNARVIAATNADLKQMGDEGTFRRDLYYRLNVFPIEIPPLRRRQEDIPRFVDFFLKKLNRLNAKEIHDVHPGVIEILMQYSWPGNIRELENLIERAYILENSSVLTPESFPSELFDSQGKNRYAINTALPLSEARRQVVEDFERRYLKDLMTRNRGIINRSAEEAGIGTRQLNKLMLKYGIRKEAFKIRE